jgi:hypothetical protein
MGTRWTEDEEKYIEEIVMSNPININWDKIGEHLGRPAGACERRSKTLIMPETLLLAKVEKLCSKDVMNRLCERQKICQTCNMPHFDASKQWKDVLECSDCYSKHKEKIKESWRLIDEYCKTNGLENCAICSKPKTEHSVFHFDHLNMFDKLDSICAMVGSGCEMVDIYEEIGKCQRICSSCHAAVTTCEDMIDFRRQKNLLTRGRNAGNDMDDVEEACRDIYKEAMQKVYQLVRNVMKVLV